MRDIFLVSLFGPKNQRNVAERRNSAWLEIMGWLLCSKVYKKTMIKTYCKNIFKNILRGAAEAYLL